MDELPYLRQLMIISDKLLYFELHKSGCSHTRKIFLDTESLKVKEYGKHNSYLEVDEGLRGDMNAKLKVGGIRNPWDWYVSMWAFGCMGKGRYRQNVEELPLEARGWAEVVLRNPGFLLPKIRKDWKDVYADAENPALFKKWLSRVFDPKRMNDSREGFKQSPISDFGGLLIYRYLRLYTYDFIQNRNSIKSLSELAEYDQKNNFIDVMIATEDINAGVREVYSRLGIAEDETERTLSKFSAKTNTSKRKGYQEYYDYESKALIAQKEEYLIKKYSYSF